MRSKDFRSFRSFRGTKKLFRGKADDCGTIKYYPHEIIIVPQKEQKVQKELRRVREQDFHYFFYFFDERSGKADDCGTIKLLSAWSNNRPAEIAESAERTSRRPVTIISAISFISAGQ